MPAFCVTYGVCAYPHQPYNGGWTVVYAKDSDEARELHAAKYGYTKNGLGRYCTIYAEEDFKQTKMYANGNSGSRCHDVIGQADTDTDIFGLMGLGKLPDFPSVKKGAV